MHSDIEPTILYFEDGGSIPNSKFPVLIYRKVFLNSLANVAEELELLFAKNNWTSSWRNGIYPYHHYHSTAHEVLGIAIGSALLQLGGGQGIQTDVEAGDIIVLPAGTGHKNLGASFDFEVVGAYANGNTWDLLKGNPGERPKADENIASVKPPTHDPVYGLKGKLMELWK